MQLPLLEPVIGDAVDAADSTWLLVESIEAVRFGPFPSSASLRVYRGSAV
jgi:hypothetical protein